MDIQKNIVEELYLNNLKEQLAKNCESLNGVMEEVIEAEGRMTTRYDSTKTEMAWVANGIVARNKKLEEIIKRVQEQNKEKVDVGSLVTVRKICNKNSIIINYMVGGKIEDCPEDVNYVNIKSSISKSLLGKVKEDIVEISINNEVTVVQVEKIVSNKEHDIIKVNTIVQVSDEYDDEEYYYICDTQGGVEIELDDDRKIIVISISTPVALELLGKKKGEKVSYTIGDMENHLQIVNFI